MMISTSVRLLVLTCSLVAGRGAFGQTFGSIDGEARDVTGAAVVGVTVSATSHGTNAVRSVVTNDAGAYSSPSLAPGTYTLRAEKPGFKAAVLNQIELQVQQAARTDIDFMLWTAKSIDEPGQLAQRNAKPVGQFLRITKDGEIELATGSTGTGVGNCVAINPEE